MPQGKKTVNIKNQLLHARQPREGIFDIRSHWRFYNYLPELQMAASILRIDV